MLVSLRLQLTRSGLIPSASMVLDFVWWRGTKLVAIDVKHARRYRREYCKGIDALLAGRTVPSYVVYLGDSELEEEGTRVLPVESFLRRLHAGDIAG